MQVDAANTAINKVIELISDRKERELNYLDKVHEKRVDQLEEEQDLIQKAFDRATNLLDDVKSKEDYEKQLADEQETADKLQQRIDYLSMSSDTDADKTKVLELQKELNEQLDKINELKRNHEYEQTKQALADDLEMYQEHFTDIQAAEDEHYLYNQQLIEERYSQENMYNEAIKALYNETFQDFQSQGIYTYDILYNKGNETAISLTDAYDNFATKTGEKFANLGIEFNNLMGLFENAAMAIEAFESDAIDWANSKNLYSLDDNYDYDISTKSTSDSYGSDSLSSSSPISSSSSQNSSLNSSLYKPKSSKEADLIAEMKANSRAWFNADTEDEQYELHLRNEDLANIIGGVTYDRSDGRWYKNGLPLYHTGRLTENAQKALAKFLGKNLSGDEEITITKSTESIIPDSQFVKLIPDTNLLTNNILSNLTPKLAKNSMYNTISHGDINVVIQGNADKKTAFTIADEVSKVLRTRER